MNRIILIGNGFDRAIQMPTRYSDFLDWVIRKSIKLLLKKDLPQNNREVFHIETSLFQVSTNKASINFVQKVIDEDLNYKEINEERVKLSTQTIFHFNLRAKHSFLELLLTFYTTNRWVDIEDLYFKFLSNIKADGIIEFNKYFNHLKEELKLFLRSIDYEHLDSNILNKYRRHFFGSILEYNNKMKYWEDSVENPEWYYFVNFNYTPFLSRLLEYSPDTVENEITINPIHGEISRDIIFGYGNETAEEYLKLETLGDEFLENIKSTHYFSGTYYKDLEVFINEPYEVYVYGLSCGPSDDVLLKTILQKTNCKQIRIFYRKKEDGANNYRNTLMNISRVFGKEKEEMRSKMISMQETDFIPQT